MPVPAPPPPDAFIRMPDDAARHQLKLALGRLSRTQRHVMLLRLRGESDLDRIAAQLQLDPATVRASLAFAHAQLRMMLSDSPQDPERNDWLLRCQALLMPKPESRAASQASPLPDRDPTPATADSGASPAPAGLMDGSRPAEPSAPSSPSDAGSQPDQDTIARTESAPGAFWLLPWLPGALALLVLISLGLLAWQVLAPPAAPTATTTATRPERSEPERMPPPLAPEAPLTAPDFSLVLLRQQHPGLLEDLDFLIWLSEQESFQ